MDMHELATTIARVLDFCGFDDITDSSGYFVVRAFDDGAERVVDVHKSSDGGTEHYAVYCCYEDDTADWLFTNTLSVDELAEKLEEIWAA